MSNLIDASYYLNQMLLLDPTGFKIESKKDGVIYIHCNNQTYGCYNFNIENLIDAYVLFKGYDWHKQGTYNKS